MATLYDLIRWVRDYMGDPRHQPRLMADHFCWHQLCAAMDTIEDTDSAVSAYLDHEFPTDTGEKYLRIYGILQGLFLQQDALIELINAIRPVKNIQPKDLLTNVLIDVRGARNKSVGHPAKLGRKAPFSTHAIVQHSMRKDGFELMSYPKQNGQIFQSVPVMELIEKQRAETFRILSEVVEDLRVQEEVHRAQFRGVKLMGVFDQVSYAFEKIFEELRRDSVPVMGTWGVGHLQTSLDNFERLLKDRGLKLKSYDSIKYIYDEIEHPLTELRKFLHREQSEVLSYKSAVVFADALRSHFDELRHMAEEIDEEYASEPEPVIRPEPKGDIQIVVTTIGEPEKVSEPRDEDGT
jgi:hypothetical protein